MYGYIYKTTNLINGKQYIGQHKAKKRLSKVYKGSGIILRKALEKYGKENFVCELLEWCETKKELNEREIYWINYFNAMEDPNFYNCSKEGQGGDCHDWLREDRAQHWLDAVREQHKLNQKGVRMVDRVNDPEQYLVNLEAKKQRFKDNPLCWYNNGIENIYIRKDEEVPEGFIKGRIQTKVWYTNGVDNLYLDSNLVEIPEGYYKGRVMPELIGRTFSKETRAKMRASWDKEKHKLPEDVEKERRRKLSESLKGKPKSKEQIEKALETRKRNKELK